ncbi:MAG TPA: hypothetical protein VM345_06170 [Acidimicrobiales bacterium]|nr:hypothetical protein [Acidimicrobiales bacterium]
MRSAALIGTSANDKFTSIANEISRTSSRRRRRHRAIRMPLATKKRAYRKARFFAFGG